MKDALDTYIDSIDHLPPTPTVVVRLISLFRKPDRDLDEVVSVMSLDPSLTAEVLRRCNSAFYGGEEQVIDVFDAIMRVGFYEVYQTAVAWFGQQAISRGPKTPGLEAELLWRHSAITAVASGQVGKKMGEAQWGPFTAGLLHDIGKVALSSAEGTKYASVVSKAGRFGPALDHEEKESFGFGHSEVGARLLHRWGVPLEISMPVFFHHYSAWPENYERSCAMVNLGNLVAHHIELGGAADMDLAPAEAAMAELGLGGNDLIEIANLTQAELATLDGMFNFGKPAKTAA